MNKKVFFRKELQIDKYIERELKFLNLHGVNYYEKT